MKRIVEKYAYAFRDCVGEEELSSSLQKLKVFIEMSENIEGLKLWLSAKFISKRHKIDFITFIAGAMRLNERVKDFLILLAERGRLDIIKDVVEKLEKEVLEENKFILKLETPIEINPQCFESVKELLKERLKKEVEIFSCSNPELLFGFRIYFDSSLFDFTVEEVFTQLKEKWEKEYVG